MQGVVTCERSWYQRVLGKIAFPDIEQCCTGSIPESYDEAKSDNKANERTEIKRMREVVILTYLRKHVNPR